MRLRIAGLTVAYGGEPVLHRVSLQVAPGEALGLVGESGSGKSTLARAVLGLLPPTAQATGEIAVDGAHRVAERRQKTGFVFQDPMTRLNPLKTIADHGLEVLRVLRPHLGRGQRQAKLRSALLAAQLEPSRANQYPHEFSGGMRQRAAIALALLLDPGLLIADEPTTSLDATVAAEVLQVLGQLRRERDMGLLLVSHDLGLVARHTDRLAVLKEGAIVEQGPTPQVFAQPRHPYTRQLVAITRREPKAIAPAQNLLVAQNLSQQYWTGPPWQRRSLRALDNVSLTVGTGERFGIVGESGSGKSTLLRVLARALNPDQGEVWLDGQNLTALRGEALRRSRRRYQLIFQDPRASLPPHLTVRQTLADGLVAHGVSRAQAAADVDFGLTKVGLAGLGERWPRELSGGQLQRVAIARALLLRPQLLLCDEPVSMLDVTIQRQILDLLLALQTEFNLTYVFVTHDLAIARWFCPRVAVLYRGQIVESGPSDRVLTQPEHPYTATLLRSVGLCEEP
ncbi:MAG: ABC transporter ATP-binding protein [Oscillatoriales cyanobacterium SM2_1_8]|nr:ABC transporter ATP-binding protein [Oscillatoriales cyanobacterium SM2_1_8]